MKCNLSVERKCIPLSILLSGLFLLVVPVSVTAQGLRMEKGEKAMCVIKMNSSGKAKQPGKIYNVEPNQLGLFKRVVNIRPSEKVAIEIMYPSGKRGEKVVVNVLDGGMLDNGKPVKLLTLNERRTCVFEFQVSRDAGLFRLLLRKGNDTKIVQLWVGPEPATAKK